MVFAKEKTSKNGYRAIFTFSDRHKVAHRLLGECDRGANLHPALPTVRCRRAEGDWPRSGEDRRSNICSRISTSAISSRPSPWTADPVPPVADSSGGGNRPHGRNMVLRNRSPTLELSLWFLPPHRGGPPGPATRSRVFARRFASVRGATGPASRDLELLFNYEDDFLVLAQTRPNWRRGSNG